VLAVTNRPFEGVRYRSEIAPNVYGETLLYQKRGVPLGVAGPYVVPPEEKLREGGGADAYAASLSLTDHQPAFTRPAEDVHEVRRRGGERFFMREREKQSDRSTPLPLSLNLFLFLPRQDLSHDRLVRHVRPQETLHFHAPVESLPPDRRHPHAPPHVPLELPTSVVAAPDTQIAVIDAARELCNTAPWGGACPI